MASDVAEYTPSLVDILSEFSAVITRLGGNFKDASVLAEVEDDLLQLVVSLRRAAAFENPDPATAHELEGLLAQYHEVTAQLDLRLGSLAAFGTYLKTRVDA
jgi:hypothetical protein